MMRFTRAATDAAALLGMGFFAAQAKADVPDLRGHWTGFGQANRSAKEIPWPNKVDFDISLHTSRRISGTGGMPDNGMPDNFPIDGTISASGDVNMTAGRDGEFHMDAHGKLRVIFAPGPTLRPPAMLMALQYHIVLPGGKQDGSMLLLQMQGGLKWDNPGQIPDVSGHWEGEYKSTANPRRGGATGMDLFRLRSSGRPTSAYGGSLRMDKQYIPPWVQTFDIFLELDGTVGPPAGQDGSSMFAAIGVEIRESDREPTVAVLIGLLTTDHPQPDVGATIQARYTLYGSVLDVVDEYWTGKSASFDSGLMHNTLLRPTRAE